MTKNMRKFIGVFFFILVIWNPLNIKASMNDIKDGTIVNSYTEFVQIIDKASKTLQPSINLVINNFDAKQYKLTDLNVKGIESIHFKGETINGVAYINSSITYNQGFKIEQSMSNSLALSRLSQEDKATIEKAKQILKTIIKDKMTDYEKELAIHDYLISNYEYDYDNYINNTIPQSSYTIYGLFTQGKGVCQAFTEATKLLLNMVGIECEIVEGNERHEWNIVKLDGEYYMLDVTWDNPYSDEKGKNKSTGISYDYFNVTNDMIAQSHSWDKEKYPIAKGTKYNYFKYNNMVANNYDEFKNLVIKSIKQGKKDISVYVNSFNANTYKLEFIFDHHRGSISYSVPKTSKGVIKIYLK